MKRLLAAIVLSILGAAVLSAEIAHVASTSEASPDKRVVTTPAIDTTGADLLIAYIGFIESVAGWEPSSYFTDSKSNSWTFMNCGENGSGTGSVGCRYAYSKPTSVGGSHTASISDNGSVNGYPCLIFAAFSGSHASPLQTSVAASQGSNMGSLAAGSIAPSQNNMLMIAGITYGQTSIDSSYGTAGTPQVVDNGDPDDGASCSLAWQIQTTATTRNPVWAGDYARASGHAAFKAASTGTAARMLLLGVK